MSKADITAAAVSDVVYGRERGECEVAGIRRVMEVHVKVTRRWNAVGIIVKNETNVLQVFILVDSRAAEHYLAIALITFPISICAFQSRC